MSPDDLDQEAYGSVDEAGTATAAAASSDVCTGGTYRCFAQLQSDDAPRTRSAQPSGLSPADLISAYHLNTALAPNATIAIVDAYNYPNAEADLAAYRAKFGLPACTAASGCFRKVNQNGTASPLPASAPANDDWTVEAALDLDMASAACPHCKLILIEANDDHGTGLLISNSTAAGLGATVISNSWGGNETAGVSLLEPYFHHTGIATFASSGDHGYNSSGAGPQYPSTSAYVISVGGTTLSKAPGSTRGWTETAWSLGGSSCSNWIAKPSYQTSTACAKHAASDIAAVGNPSTGVAVYNGGKGGWVVVGGTSASSPFVAGVYALYGLGATTPAWIYAHTNYFYDVTSGKNGTCMNVMCNATVGWDALTGIGTPNGALL